MKKSFSDRIIEEFKDFSENPLTDFGITVELLDNNDPTKWKVTMIDPKESSYKDGIFNILVDFPPEYPQKPPEVCFLTPIYHLDINSRVPSSSWDDPLGHVNINIINMWKPEYGMKVVLTGIFELFYATTGYCPYGVDRTYEFMNNRELYEKKVRYFTQKYANPFHKRYKRDKDWNFDYPNDA